MCIVFIYNGYDDPESDYSLILASNRDEFYDRLTLHMAPWHDDTNILGGIDLGADGISTWLAYSSSQKKVGLLLNYPDVQREKPKSRGKIIADYMKSNNPLDDYVSLIRHYGDNCNGFIFVTVEIGGNKPTVRTYTNATNKLQTWTESCTGFSNNIPDNPLTKVSAGKERMAKLCEEYKTVEDKPKLIDSLIQLLKSDERHLPDPILEKRRPKDYHWFSSIYVCVPPVRYGTRTHTLMLVTKKGQVNLIEVTMQTPIDLSNPVWKKSSYQL
ncbi:unnamed protein product [Leptosia nina]|uniref:Uncharacterized protein n=1 Tax=Leptosia nina TaxID=320188 RepID=A0AAV1IX83_9NEOP